MKNNVTTSLFDFEMIKGVRVKNGSIKIYKGNDGQFIVLLKKYLWKLPVTNKCITTRTYEEAEDYLIWARFDGRIS